MRIRVEGKVFRYGHDWRVSLAGHKPRVVLGERLEDMPCPMLHEEYCDAVARSYGCKVDRYGYISNWDEVKHIFEEWMNAAEKGAVQNVPVPIGAAGF